MSVGLLAVVDDILAAALKASAKATGVVIDDAAVTPQYVQGLTPARELPVVAKIALGSIVNKVIVIIPLALVLTAFAPWVLPFLLILGGAFLSYEGAEKVLEWFGRGHHEDGEGVRNERSLVLGAVRTDLILSAEIMFISLSGIDPALGLWPTAVALLVIALLMTAGVYGVVALLVKLDDIGLSMVASSRRGTRRIGAAIVRAMPAIFRVIGVVGTIAMLWVGGHLVLVNLGEAGWQAPAELLHGVEHLLHPLGPVLSWVGESAIAAIAGVTLGILVVVLLAALRRLLSSLTR